MADVTAGVETTEHKVAKSAEVWGSIATILGMIMSMGSAVLPALGDNSRIGIIAGVLIAVAGILHKSLVQLGYIKSRTEVKVAAAKGEIG